MGQIDEHSEIKLVLTHNGKEYEYVFPKVETAHFNIEHVYPHRYWDDLYSPLYVARLKGCDVSLTFRAIPDGEKIFTVKTDPPLISRRHPPKKRVRKNAC